MRRRKKKRKKKKKKKKKKKNLSRFLLCFFEKVPSALSLRGLVMEADTPTDSDSLFSSLFLR